MALQATVFSGPFPSRLLSGALWSASKVIVGAWAKASSSSSVSADQPISSEPSTAQYPSHVHEPACRHQRPLESLRFRALTLIPSTIVASSRLASVHPARPWLSTEASFTTVASGRAAIAAAPSVRAKRPENPTAAGPEDAVTRGKAIGGSGTSSKSAHRAKSEPVKEMHLKPRISEHDLAYRLRQMEGWLADGIRTKLVVEFRGEDQSEAAATLADSVLSRLAAQGQPLAPRQQNKESWIVTLRPGPPKQQKQAKQAKEAPPVKQPPQQQSQQQSQPQSQPQEQQPGKRSDVGAPKALSAAA